MSNVQVSVEASPPRSRRWLATETSRAVALFMAAAVAAFVVHVPSIGHDFCPVDDAYFVRENPIVQGGLTWPGIQAAWTKVHASYWAPLLWMSFMLDQEISGGAPWSFHLTNASLFALNAGLLFLLVRRWTGRNGLAFAAALLWALHPARVESVAWITERKDVLSGLFVFLGLWFYTVGRQASTARDPKTNGRHGVPSLPPTTNNQRPTTKHVRSLGNWILDIGHWILRSACPHGLASSRMRRRILARTLEEYS